MEDADVLAATVAVFPALVVAIRVFAGDVVVVVIVVGTEPPKSGI